MRKFFSQFGTVKRLRLSRSKKVTKLSFSLFSCKKMSDKKGLKIETFICKFAVLLKKARVMKEIEDYGAKCYYLNNC